MPDTKHETEVIRQMVREWQTQFEQLTEKMLAIAGYEVVDVTAEIPRNGFEYPATVLTNKAIVPKRGKSE